MHVGLFGGSFNPPHMGHGMACYYLLETTPLERIWLVPAYRHAFDKPLVSFEHRLEMCARLAAPFAGRVEVSGIERERGGVSYTIDTVRFIRRRYPTHTFEWIIGADILEETVKWKDFDLLKTIISFRVLARDGYPGGGGVTIPNVSSTEIRRRLASGQSIDGLVPASVKAYLEANRLYDPAESSGAKTLWR